MRKEIIVPYPKIRNRLCTFTIINTEHRNILYRLIGHTAVVYKCQETGQLMVFESTTINKATGRSGVQLTPMGFWLHHYPGKVFVRIPEFSYPDVKNKIDERIENLDRYALANTFIQKHLGSSYPDLKTWTGKMKLFLAALDLKIFGKDIFTYRGDDKGIFCTMLVVMFLQYCGLLGCLNLSQKQRVIPAHEYEPDDTRGSAGMFDKYLISCKYGKEICIKG